MAKTYNTPKRTHIVKTRLDDEEHAEFMRRMELYEMSQAEFIREAIRECLLVRYTSGIRHKSLPHSRCRAAFVAALQYV